MQPSLRVQAMRAVLVGTDDRGGLAFLDGEPRAGGPAQMAEQARLTNTTVDVKETTRCWCCVGFGARVGRATSPLLAPKVLPAAWVGGTIAAMSRSLC